MRNASKVSLCSTVLLLLFCRLAPATPIVYSYVTDQSTYNVQVGQTVTVNIYLQEILNGNTSIIVGHGEDGLYGAAFEILSAMRPTNPSLITAGAANTADFNGGSQVVRVNNSHVSNPNELDLEEGISLSNTMGVGLANGNGAAANQVFLGTVTVTAGSTPGATTFNLGEYNIDGNNANNTVTDPHGYDLDNSSTVGGTAYTGAGSTVTTFTVNATAAPEPGSLSLIAGGAQILLLRRRRLA